MQSGLCDIVGNVALPSDKPGDGADEGYRWVLALEQSRKEFLGKPEGGREVDGEHLVPGLVRRVVCRIGLGHVDPGAMDKDVEAAELLQDLVGRAIGLGADSRGRP